MEHWRKEKPGTLAVGTTVVLGVVLLLLMNPWSSPNAFPTNSSVPRSSGLAAIQGNPTSLSGSPTLGPRTPAATVAGVDVSEAGQGTTPVNWATAYSNGVRFAWAKATQSNDFQDPTFPTNMQNAPPAGVYIGAYDYGCPVTDSKHYCTATNATVEANYFDSYAGPYFKSGYLYPALDLEEGCGTLSASQLSQWVVQWMNTVEGYIQAHEGQSIAPILYMDTNYATNCVDSSVTAYPLWVADYWNTCATSPSPGTGIFSTYAFWQWCSSNTVGGIPGTSVDQDLFNGNIAQLQSGYVFGLRASYGMQDLTTSTPLTCGGTFQTGDQIQFTGSVSGGTSPYSYAWNFDDGTTGSGQTTTHAFQKVNAAMDTLLTVTDTNQLTNTTGYSCAFDITAGLLVSTPLVASLNPVPLGNTTHFSVSATGGNTPYSYSYSGLPSGCSSSNTANLTCSPNASGSFPVNVTITDSKGRTVTSSTTLNVQVPPLTISAFAAFPSTVLVNHTTDLNVTASGGLAPYSYAYLNLPPGCSSKNAGTLSCTPTSSGSFNVTVTVNDSQNQSMTDNTTLVVTNPSSLVITSFSASPTPILVNTNTTLKVVVSGGTPSFSYAYSRLPAGCASSNTAQLPCTPTVPGSYTVQVTVTDSSRPAQSASKTVSLSVTPSRDPTITSFTAQPPTVHVGNVTVLTVKVSGGTAPYKYAYTGLPSGCGSTDRAILNCTPTVNGTYSVNVTVTDVQGRTVRSSLVLEVLTTSSGSSPNSGWSSLVPWLLVVGIAVVAVVALALLIRRRRARGHGTPPTPSSEPSQPFA